MDSGAIVGLVGVVVGVGGALGVQALDARRRDRPDRLNRSHETAKHARALLSDLMTASEIRDLQGRTLEEAVDIAEITEHYRTVNRLREAIGLLADQATRQLATEFLILIESSWLITEEIRDTDEYVMSHSIIALADLLEQYLRGEERYVLTAEGDQFLKARAASQAAFERRRAELEDREPDDATT